MVQDIGTAALISVVVTRLIFHLGQWMVEESHVVSLWVWLFECLAGCLGASDPASLFFLPLPWYWLQRPFGLPSLYFESGTARWWAHGVAFPGRLPPPRCWELQSWWAPLRIPSPSRSAVTGSRLWSWLVAQWTCSAGNCLNQHPLWSCAQSCVRRTSSPPQCLRPAWWEAGARGERCNCCLSHTLSQSLSRSTGITPLPAAPVESKTAVGSIVQVTRISVLKVLSTAYLVPWYDCFT